jgi:putative tryptophan/tyrosine transport system substrate-binding protein
MIARREFITLLGGAAAWPIAARAQQTAMPVVGFISSRSPGESEHLVAALYRGLSEAGYVEGKNLFVAFRWADGKYDRLPSLVANLVALQVSVMVAAGGSPPALAAKAATSAIPIVFTASSDPVRIGLVASLNRPGGNVTGMALYTSTIEQKRLELLHELVPKATGIAMLVNPDNPNAETEAQLVQQAAGKLGLRLHVLKAGTEVEIDAIFATLLKLNVGALMIASDAYFDGRREQFATLTRRYAMPAIYQYREFTAAGNLIAYGANLADNYRKAGQYAGRILRGERPSDLPVLWSSFESAVQRQHRALAEISCLVARTVANMSAPTAGCTTAGTT